MTSPAAENPAVARPPRRGVSLLLLLGLLVGLCLLPYANCGFVGDDSLNSVFKGQLKLEKTTFWPYMVTYNQHWMDKGRFFPLGLLITFGYWVLVSSLWVSRAIQIALIGLNIVLAARFLRRLTGSGAVAAVFAAILPAFFQIRVNVGDPMTSFCPLLQVTLLFMLLGCHQFLLALERGSPGRMTLAWLFCGSGFLTYEVALSAAAITALIAAFYWRRSPRLAFAGLLGVLTLAVVFVAINLYLKAHTTIGYEGTTISLSAAAVGRTFAIQAASAIPFIFYWKFGRPIFAEAPAPGIESLALALMIFALSVYAVQRALRQPGAIDRRRTGLVMLIGGCLIVIPSAVISISARYQQELRWGLGYLPVYLQFFGLAGIVAVAVRWAFSGGAGKLRAVVAVLLGAVAGVGNAGAFLANGIIAEYVNVEWRYLRAVLESAARANFFSTVPEGCTLAIDQPSMWDTPAFYRLYTHRRFSVVATASLLAGEADTFFARRDFSSRPIYQLRYVAAPWRNGGGYAILARLQSLDFRKAGGQVSVIDRTLRDPVCFHKNAAQSSMRQMNSVQTGLEATEEGVRPPRRVDFPLTPVSAAGDWTISPFPPGEYRINSTALPTPSAPPVSVHRPVLLRSPDSDRLQIASWPESRALTGIGFGCEQGADGIEFEPAYAERLEVNCPDQKDGFAMAFRVRPSSLQLPGAVLASNYRSDGRGFKLEKAAAPGQYVLTVGDGAWHAVGPVTLRDDRWNLVVLNFSPVASSVYAAGEQVTQSTAAFVPAGVGDSAVVLGNENSGAHPFRGKIKDIVLRARPFTAEELDRMTNEEASAARD